MQRPMMDPMLMLEDDGGMSPRRPHPIRHALGAIVRGARVAGRVLFSKPFRIRRRELQDQQPLVTRFVKAVGYRLLFAPIFVALASAALVYRGTHPMRVGSDKLPLVPGAFYETVEFNGPDGHPLMAWFVPVVDAKRVLEMKDKVFRGKQPAVVLVHDFNESPSQMVPLVAPLHEQGYVVMVVGLRGVGRERVAAQTFGLNEAVDVRGALAELRKRPTVDMNRVAVVGVGSGANAAVIAASQESAVRALVLVDPTETTRQAIAERIGPTNDGLRWMQHASKWAFEMAYHVDAEDLNVAPLLDGLRDRATLKLSRAKAVTFDAATFSTIRSFCREHVPVDDAGTFATTSN
jgi:pimeloyl-ACP methyl ester carboxylesterase